MKSIREIVEAGWPLGGIERDALIAELEEREHVARPRLDEPKADHGADEENAWLNVE